MAFNINAAGQATTDQTDMFGRRMNPYALNPGDLYMHPSGHVTRQASGQGNPFALNMPTVSYTPQQWQEQLSRDEKGLAPVAPMISMALTAAGLPGFISNAVGGGLLGSMASGAAMGGLNAAMGGGNVLQGALAGGLGSGVSSGLGSALQGSGLSDTARAAITGAAGGATRAAVRGGNVGEAALGGGLSGFGGAAGRDFAAFSGVNNPVFAGLLGQLPNLARGLLADRPQQRTMPLRIAGGNPFNRRPVAGPDMVVRG